MAGAGVRSRDMTGKDLGIVGLGAQIPSPVGHHALSTLAERPEPQLLELAQRGDRGAWTVLIKRHDHRVVLSLLARGIRIDQARELAHQTWIRLIAQQAAGRLERIELPGLAIRQAGFLALDAARRGSPAADASPPDSAGLVDPEASIEERLIRREELVRVQAELARCSPVARALFDLLYTHPEMPHAEAARRLGLSVQRVRQTLCEVRARLRAAIETEPSR